MKILRKVGLPKAAFRIYEVIEVADLRFLYRNARYLRKATPDGLPIPPLRLIILVTGTASIPWFIQSGKDAVQSIVDTLRKNGLDIDAFQAILDFGCGCGRVTRYWDSLKRAKVYGTDYNPKAIAWCQQNLTFAQFDTNQMSPPLSYNDGKFDFIYVLSVFTHMPEALQLLWIDELSRVLVPGGYLLITTAGEGFTKKLTQNKREEFRAGRLVVKDEEAVGSNLCCAFHPPSYVREKLANGFEVIDFIPEGAKGNGGQDIFLLRKPLNND